MKLKLSIISTLAGILFLVSSIGAWADSRKHRHHRKQYRNRIHQEIHHHYHWDAADRHYWKKHRKRHRINHHHWVHDHGCRYRPHQHHYYRYRPWHQHYHHSHWHMKKHRHYKHSRPIYKHTDGKVSVIASASDHGWSIKISAKDKKRFRKTKY